MAKNAFETTTEKLETPCANLYLILGADENNEITYINAHIGKCGGCAYANVATITSLLMGIFKYCKPQDRIAILTEAVGNKCISDSTSCSDQIIRTLIEHEEARASGATIEEEEDE
jgi:hypothetical protein